MENPGSTSRFYQSLGQNKDLNNEVTQLNLLLLTEFQAQSPPCLPQSEYNAQMKLLKKELSELTSLNSIKERRLSSFSHVLNYQVRPRTQDG